MERFRSTTGVAALIERDDIDTDQVLPAAYLRGFKPDYRKGFFAHWRNDPDFVLARPEYAETRIIVTGRNFGCGSTREHAVWACHGFGIRVIIALGFADIFRENCLKNGVLPVILEEDAHARVVDLVRRLDGACPLTVDLEQQTITGPDGFVLPFNIAGFERRVLLEGLDEVGLSLQSRHEIDAYEERARVDRRWEQDLPVF